MPGRREGANGNPAGGVERGIESMSELSETGQIIIGLFFLVSVFLLTRMGVAWQLKRASVNIVKDLKRNNAYKSESAVNLPYAKTQLFKIGLRDYRPKALEGLVREGIVGMTAEGKYYLKVSLPHITV